MRIEPDTIAKALLLAPGWTRVGLTAPTADMREAAARELAVAILSSPQMQEDAFEADQLELAL